MPIIHPIVPTKRISFEEGTRMGEDVGINRWKTNLFLSPW